MHQRNFNISTPYPLFWQFSIFWTENWRNWQEKAIESNFTFLQKVRCNFKFPPLLLNDDLIQFTGEGTKNSRFRNQFPFCILYVQTRKMWPFPAVYNSWPLGRRKKWLFVIILWQTLQMIRKKRFFFCCSLFFFPTFSYVVIHKPCGQNFGHLWPPPPSWSLVLNKAYVIKWSFGWPPSPLNFPCGIWMSPIRTRPLQRLDCKGQAQKV